jgi:predicted nucleic acid-binding protein
MPGGDFLDTNVLVYVFDRRQAQRHAAARELLERGQRERSAVISHQVVQETLSVLTRKLRPALSAQDADSVLTDVLLPLWTVSPTAALYRSGLILQARYGFSFYDSLIVAAALEAGCRRLLSEDLQHGQTIDGLSIENPFLGLP